MSRLSPDRVVDAALTLVDEAGLEGLSMRRLGSALNVEAMSLYKHVPNKQALLDGVRQRLVAKVSVEGSVVGWKGLLAALAHAAHRLLRAHPKAAPLFASSDFSALCTPEDLERVQRRMREMGFGEHLRALALKTVGAYVMGCLRQAEDEAGPFEDGLELVLAGVEAARRWPRSV